MNTVTENFKDEVVALDFIASMTYQTKLNVECLENKVMKLQASSPIKDVVIYFVENQKNWVNKLMKGLQKVNLKDNMQRDLNSADLAYYSIVCEYARQTWDMLAAANLMEFISQAKEITVEQQERIIDILKAVPEHHEAYWEMRCKAAEKFITESAIDNNQCITTPEQSAARLSWHEIVNTKL